MNYNDLYMRHFAAPEFRDWLDNINPRLLVMIDLLRWRWGDSIKVSPVKGSIGRHKGDSESSHNVDYWGQVNAIDLFPASLQTKDDCWKFVEMATNLGFTGIGIYPDAKPSIMAHVDVRPTADYGQPATWGALRSDSGWDYVALHDAIDIARL